MEENNNQNNMENNVEAYKEETVKTFNEVKENLKNVDIKQEAQKGKGFLKDLWTRPIEKIKEIAKDESNSYFKTIVLVIALWCIAVAVLEIIGLSSIKSLFRFNTIKKIVLTAIEPIVKVVALAAVVMVVNKEKKKSLMTSITTVGTAKIPLVIAAVLNLLNLISYNISSVLLPVRALLTLISTVLTYFAVKELFEIEDDAKAVKKFVLCMAIYEVVAFVFYLLGIYIY